MDEMNRRQKWDRSFENMLLEFGEETRFQEEKEEEGCRRMKWDQDHRGPGPLEADGRQLPPDAPPIDPKPWKPFSRWCLKRSKLRK